MRKSLHSGSQAHLVSSSVMKQQNTCVWLFQRKRPPTTENRVVLLQYLCNDLTLNVA